MVWGDRLRDEFGREEYVRILVVISGLSIAILGALSFGVQLTRWEATTYVTPQDSETNGHVTNVSDLPPACQRIAHALVDGQTVSSEVYQFRLGGMSIMVRNTNLSGRWYLSDTNCIDRRDSNPNLQTELLRVNDNYYEVKGYWARGNLEKRWFFDLFRTMSFVTGAILILFGHRPRSY